MIFCVILCVSSYNPGCQVQSRCQSQSRSSGAIHRKQEEPLGSNNSCSYKIHQYWWKVSKFTYWLSSTKMWLRWACGLSIKAQVSCGEATTGFYLKKRKITSSFFKNSFFCRFSFFCLSLIISVSACSKFVLIKVIDLPELYLVCSFLHEPSNCND